MMDEELKPPAEQLLNLFRLKRTRGWWPFTAPDADGNPTLSGKVDLELQLPHRRGGREESCWTRPGGTRASARAGQTGDFL